MDEAEFFKQRVGTVLRDKWTLEKLLGWGGMAAVYVGLHKIGRRDAIKILHPEMVPHKEIRARFEQEAHAVNRLQHPSAVRILDIDTTEDGAPFLVMELLDGESLQDRLAHGPIPIADVLRYADELLDVLVAAHDHGIVHRDIKPDNLFVMRDGSLKVLDFGIARMREGQPKTIRTKIGVTMGTLSYMPPEQVAGKEIDGRADLFAVGCTLFRVIAGRNPHEGNSDLELMAKMGMQPAPPLRGIATSAPYEVALIVDRALSFDRDHRYSDARTMQEDVRAVRRGAPPPMASRMAIEDPLSASEVSPSRDGAASGSNATSLSAPGSGGPGSGRSGGIGQPVSNYDPSQRPLITQFDAPPSSYGPTHLFNAPAYLAEAQPIAPAPQSSPTAGAPSSRSVATASKPKFSFKKLERRTWFMIAGGATFLLGLVVLGSWCAARDDDADDPMLAEPTATARTPGNRPVHTPRAKKRRKGHRNRED